MMMRFAILALAGLLSFPAVAEEGANLSSKNAPGTRVEMPPIISPMQDARGRLSGYAYISATIIATSPNVAVAIRAKTPFIQDAFVRNVNARSVGLGTDPAQIDKAGVETRFLAEARTIAGARAVKSVIITQVQMSALRGGPPSSVPAATLAQTAAAPQHDRSEASAR
ncbi:MAG TPA: hypothetical protein VL026_10725 [Rhizomicrobium sp.]|nr:hypothetical protein [Rhizomicrobium sp.]